MRRRLRSERCAKRSAPGVPGRREAWTAFRRGEIDAGRFGVYRTRDWGPAEVRGNAVKDLALLNDRYGTRGMARGAVVLIISGGWETGYSELLGRQAARLSRVSYRIVWANRAPSRRAAGARSAAWPYCDAVVSAHNLDALDDLLAALS